MGVGPEINERGIECFVIHYHQNVDNIMYIQSSIVMPSLYHYCHVNETILSLFIVVDVNVAVNNKRVFSVAMLMDFYRATKYFLLLLRIVRGYVFLP